MARANGSCRGDSAPLHLDGDSADFDGLVFAPGSDGSQICLVNVRGFDDGIELQSDDNAIRFSRIGLSADGTSADANGTGIVVTGDDNLVGEANVISGNELTRIFVGEATGTRIEGNFIGLDADGTAAVPNDTGILVGPGTSDTTVGGADARAGNVISGNVAAGVELRAAATVQGNWIGLAGDGTTPVLSGTGILIGEDTAGAQVGGMEEQAGNIVATEGEAGIAVAGDDARIEGNTVGLNSDGNATGGGFEGIRVEGLAAGTRIGGDEPGAGNTISDNDTGIVLEAGSVGTIVEANLIGTDPEGLEARPNGDGVLIEGDSRETEAEPAQARIGGARVSQRNVISGNEETGVIAGDTANAVIEGNYIGVGADGSTPLGNHEGLEIGPFDRDVPSAPAPGDGIVVGGTAAGAGNRIAHNRGDGVAVGQTAGGVTILGNESFANGGLGIDFDADGVSANGSEDPNLLPRFPVLTNADLAVAGTLVQGTIDHPANRTVRIEFFSSPTCDNSGHGEGQTPLGALTLAGSGRRRRSAPASPPRRPAT